MLLRRLLSLLIVLVLGAWCAQAQQYSWRTRKPHMNYNGPVKAVTVNIQVIAGDDDTIAYTYKEHLDKEGHLVSTEHIQGTQHRRDSFAYDGNNLLTRQTTWTNGVKEQHIVYTNDSAIQYAGDTVMGYSIYTYYPNDSIIVTNVHTDKPAEVNKAYIKNDKRGNPVNTISFNSLGGVRSSCEYDVRDNLTEQTFYEGTGDAVYQTTKYVYARGLCIEEHIIGHGGIMLKRLMHDYFNPDRHHNYRLVTDRQNWKPLRVARYEFQYYNNNTGRN